ncbi:curli production assembly/transport protein CsgG [Verticiella sediminum]|uniref:Curli production assembly/transport protein CsgG n=1 Tax=Verticiella sediminum TaxID=1247510 RepID=A0A556AC67_9BURK|nr:CsgG/HfaB family protein [Verticiella sediminum]TSH90484.1 curli production assembly/transport protein CsgG [Verticiella sediminum]
MKTHAKPAPRALRNRLPAGAGALAVAALLSACAAPPGSQPAAVTEAATLTPPSPATRDLLKLPSPKGRVVAAVYGFRDQTGQYKPSPDSSFSTSVTQGAASLLIKALKDSGWFTPVERESLQELLTERRIVRALDGSTDDGVAATQNVPGLLPAAIMVDGGVIAYESNVRTGGAGARFLGIGMSTQYRVDQVTVNLRSVDIRNGQILHSVSTTKTIYSYELHPSVFRFVNFKELLEVEAGVTSNEPAQLCVKEAIETAVVHLIAQGIKDRSWVLANESDWESPVLQAYMREADSYAVDATELAAMSTPAARPPSPY